MLAWQFERKIFSPTIQSESSTFIMKKQKKKKKKKKTTFFFYKKMNFEGYSRRKIGDAKIYIHRQLVAIAISAFLYSF